MEETLLMGEDEDRERDTRHALLVLRVAPVKVRCSPLTRLTCTVSLEASEQSKAFSLAPLALCSGPHSGVSVLDVPEFWAPSLVTITLHQDTLVRRLLLCSHSLSLADIVRTQGRARKDDSYWGLSRALRVGGPVDGLDLLVRFVELRGCVSTEPLMQRSELQLAAALGTGKLVSKLLFALSRRSLVREALFLRHNDRHNALDCALLAGNAETTRELLRRSGSLCFQGTAHGSACALHHCVQGGSHACMKTLLTFLSKHGRTVIGWDGTLDVLVEWTNEEGLTPLMLACRAGAVRMVRTLVRYGASAATVNGMTGRTCLMYAAEGGHCELALVLLALRQGTLFHGRQVCRPNSPDLLGKTALLVAAEGRHSALVLALLRHKCSPFLPDNQGALLLHVLARTGDMAAIDAVLDQEARLMAENEAARRRTRYLSVPKRRSLLLARDAQGSTALDVARRCKSSAAAAAIEAAMMMCAEQEAKEGGEKDGGDKEGDYGFDGDRADALDYAFALSAPATRPALQGYYSMVRLQNEQQLAFDGEDGALQV